MYYYRERITNKPEKSKGNSVYICRVMVLELKFHNILLVVEFIVHTNLIKALCCKLSFLSAKSQKSVSFLQNDHKHKKLKKSKKGMNKCTDINISYSYIYTK